MTLLALAISDCPREKLPDEIASSSSFSKYESSSADANTDATFDARCGTKENRMKKSLSSIILKIHRIKKNHLLDADDVFLLINPYLACDFTVCRLILTSV